jgi:hypothetical protein
MGEEDASKVLQTLAWDSLALAWQGLTSEAQIAPIQPLRG